MKIRLIPYSENTACVNMGIDEYFLNEDIKENEAVIRFYGWSNDTISIGRFQGVDYEIDKDRCKKDKIDVVRRITGGGAVFHDNIGELTYSFVTRETDELEDMNNSYIKITKFIIDTLNRLNIKAEFKPLNDIMVEGRKISGNAQTRKDDMILQHGTILLYVSSERMFNYLKISDEKMKHKLIKSIPKLVVSISKYVPDISKEKLQEELIETLKEDNEVKIMSLSKEEREEAKQFIEKYEKDEWTFSR